VVAQTHVREETLLEGPLSGDVLKAAASLALQPAPLLDADRQRPHIHPLLRRLDPLARHLLQLEDRHLAQLPELRLVPPCVAPKLPVNVAKSECGCG
jgi:hypothetical protein